MNRLLGLLLVLTCSTTAIAQSVSLTGPRETEVNQVFIIGSDNSVGDHFKWITPDSTLSLAGTNGIALMFSSPGEKLVQLVASNVNGIAIGEWKIVVKGGIGPAPTPQPQPQPLPPPVPDEFNPIPFPGFRVLVVYDSKLGVPQQTTAKAVRDYAALKCVKGPDNKTAEYRVLDQETDVSNMTDVWKTTMARKRASLPWIVVSNGKQGYEGPLPQTTEDTLTLLKKYGGL